MKRGSDLLVPALLAWLIWITAASYFFMPGIQTSAASLSNDFQPGFSDHITLV